MNTHLGFSALMALLCGLLALPGAAESAPPAPVAPAEIQASAGRPEVLALEAELARLVVSDDAKGLSAALQRVESPPHDDPLLRARMRYAALMSFARVSESSGSRDQLERYLASEPEVYVWHEDGAHRVAIPAFDPAAAAAYALSEWNRKAWQQRAQLGLQAGSQEFLDDWLTACQESGGRLSDAGLVSAFGRASQEELDGWSARLAILLREGLPVAGIAQTVALRTADTGLAGSILRDADTFHALRFMQAYADTTDPETETSVLRHALGREDLASAALYRLARLETHEGRALLLVNLASPTHGSSAAAALARRITPDLIESLSDLVASGDDMRARRRAVLALQLAHEAGGRQALQRLYRDRALPADLRSQIARHLP